MRLLAITFLLAALAVCVAGGATTAPQKTSRFDSYGYFLGSDVTTRAPSCFEDEPCWNCSTMGNRVCGPVGCVTDLECARSGRTGYGVDEELVREATRRR
jgi:hypothetical protein